MLASVKLLYWKIENFIVEFYIKIKKVPNQTHPHNIKQGLVVSLTSFPPRFAKLHLTLKGLLLQSITPDFIILWVAEADFDHLTPEVFALEREYSWFIIKKCNDIRSYKKLIPALKEFPTHYIVTADDDLFYPKDWLKKLVIQISDEKQVIAHRVHSPEYFENKLLPYHNWHFNSKGKGRVLFATGIGGILYPPDTFSDEVFNEDQFMKLCPTADDIWFFWMARKNGVYAIWSGYDLSTVNWTGTNESGLAIENVKQGMNDICFNRMIDAYGDVFTTH